MVLWPFLIVATNYLGQLKNSFYPPSLEKTEGFLSPKFLELTFMSTSLSIKEVHKRIWEVHVSIGLFLFCLALLVVGRIIWVKWPEWQEDRRERKRIKELNRLLNHLKTHPEIEQGVREYYSK